MLFAEKYQLLEQIGEGAMGVVYRARHSLLDIEVAVKVLRPQYANDEVFRARFLREARLPHSFVHKHAATLRDFGIDENGTPYLTMDLCPGVPLSELISDLGTLPPRRAVIISAQVLEVLHEAHTAGILHRDIKPDNVMVDDSSGEDRIRVMDFGIAKIMEGEAKEADLTRGSAIGTPLYMSPEQAAGETLDCRSDIYSMGVVLYEMLSGRAPFAAASVQALLLKHLTNPPPPLPEAEGITPFLKNIVNRALAKTAEERFASALEFHTALQEYLEDPNRSTEATQKTENSSLEAPASARAEVSEIRDWASDPDEFLGQSVSLQAERAAMRGSGEMPIAVSTIRPAGETLAPLTESSGGGIVALVSPSRERQTSPGRTATPPADTKDAGQKDEEIQEPAPTHAPSASPFPETASENSGQQTAIMSEEEGAKLEKMLAARSGSQSDIPLPSARPVEAPVAAPARREKRSSRHPSEAKTDPMHFAPSAGNQRVKEQGDETGDRDGNRTTGGDQARGQHRPPAKPKGDGTKFGSTDPSRSSSPRPDHPRAMSAKATEVMPAHMRLEAAAGSAVGEEADTSPSRRVVRIEPAREDKDTDGKTAPAESSIGQDSTMGPPGGDSPAHLSSSKSADIPEATQFKPRPFRALTRAVGWLLLLAILGLGGSATYVAFGGTLPDSVTARVNEHPELVKLLLRLPGFELALGSGPPDGEDAPEEEATIQQEAKAAETREGAQSASEQKAHEDSATTKPGRSSGKKPARARGHKTATGSGRKSPRSETEDLLVVDLARIDRIAYLNVRRVRLSGPPPGHATRASVHGQRVDVKHGKLSTILQLQEGRNAIQVVGDSPRGSVVRELELIVDTHPPRLALESPVDGFVFKRPRAPVVGTVSDPNLAEIWLNDTQVTVKDGRFSLLYPLELGKNELRLSASDRAGNRSNVSLTVTRARLSSRRR